MATHSDIHLEAMPRVGGDGVDAGEAGRQGEDTGRLLVMKGGSQCIVQVCAQIHCLPVCLYLFMHEYACMHVCLCV